MKQIIIILVLLFAGLSGLCQTADLSSGTGSECSAKVLEASMLFEKGQYDKCISLLESVTTTCQLTKKEKARALELLAKSYIETDEPLKAETALSAMLTNDPHYELNEANHYESYNRTCQKVQCSSEILCWGS
jgi:hypothetical protein